MVNGIERGWRRDILPLFGPEQRGGGSSVFEPWARMGRLIFSYSWRKVILCYNILLIL